MISCLQTVLMPVRFTTTVRIFLYIGYNRNQIDNMPLVHLRYFEVAIADTLFNS